MDVAEKTLHPAYRKIKFKEISDCPNCHSTEIEKTYSKDESIGEYPKLDTNHVLVVRLNRNPKKFKK